MSSQPLLSSWYCSCSCHEINWESNKDFATHYSRRHGRLHCSSRSYSLKIAFTTDIFALCFRILPNWQSGLILGYLSRVGTLFRRIILGALLEWPLLLLSKGSEHFHKIHCWIGFWMSLPSTFKGVVVEAIGASALILEPAWLVSVHTGLLEFAAGPEGALH